MIAMLLSLVVAAAPDSSTSIDTTPIPFHLSATLGPILTNNRRANLWSESAVQAEFSDLAILRYGYCLPAFDGGGANSPQAADLERYSHTISLGKEWRKGNRWWAVGGGWSWMRFDTTALAVDPRTVFVEDGGGLHLVTTSSPGMFGASEVPDHIGWKWAVPVKDRSPYLFAEAGNGWSALSYGVRAEYRYGFGFGFFMRLRLPWWSVPGTSANG